MRPQTFLSVIAVTVLAAVGAASPAAATAPATTSNLLNAMHGEALAYARYNAFADDADRTGHADVAALFRSTADQERNEHFAEQAAFVDLVSDQATNLRTAIAAELDESTTLYPAYARQARADGDRAATRLFHELAADEATHQRLLRQALCALERGRAYPAPPDVEAVTIVAGPARSHGTTLDNITAALRGEAFASARYAMYATAATSEGNSPLAAALLALSDVERLDHFAALANLAGLVGDVADNLASAVAGENYETAVMYPGYAAAATAAGDTAVGTLLTEIGGDEAKHRDAYAAALTHL